MLDVENKSTISVQEAVEQLRAGELVSFPTETVYGLGADAKNPLAVAEVYATKQRPTNRPLIVHIHSSAEISEWASNIPEIAYKLAANFWPGPLTMILPKHPQVQSIVTANHETIALRVPNHPKALELLKAFGSGLVGPSANSFGKISPTCAAHVKQDLGEEIAGIVDGGICDIGIESTIIDLTTTPFRIVRQGNISPLDIQERCGIELEVFSGEGTTPGTSSSHYAPNTTALLVNANEIIETVLKSQTQHTIAILSTQTKPHNLSSNNLWIQADTNPGKYAKSLYANLHTLDKHGAKYIFIEAPPERSDWAAINDRLHRACSSDG